jgi:hypothetical protein
MDPEESSTRWLTSFSVRALDSFRTRGANSGLVESGRTEHLRGAMTGGRAR